MKKFILTICVALICGITCAQTEHLTFKGIPIDGSRNEFVKELKRQGYASIPDMEDIFSGSFTGRDSYIFVASTPVTNTMWKVGVLFETTYNTWSLIKQAYDGLIKVYVQKYGSPIHVQKDFMDPWNEGDGHELLALRSDRCVYKTIFTHVKEGVIIGYIGISMTTNCQILIEYEDNLNSDLLKEEKAQDI